MTRAIRMKTLKSLVRDGGGVAAVEFAFVFPVMLTLYIGTYQLCDGVSAYRKVTTTARAIADLTSQYTSVSDADLDSVLAASTQIMAPYPVNAAAMTVTQVSVDNSGNATVAWSRGLNTTPLTTGSAYTLPSSIRTPNTSLIVSDVSYTYRPGVMTDVVGNIPIHDKILMSPRSVSSITKKVS